MTGLNFVPFCTVIGIATLNRPILLANLLTVMSGQIRDAPENHVIRIMVVDNDANSSALEVVETVARAHPQLRIEYLNEPRRGIGHARNMAFSAVREGEWLIFFDDDQIPNGRWLNAFMQERENPDAQVIFGPVTPEFGTALPHWGSGGWAWGASRSELTDRHLYRTTGFGNVMFASVVLGSESCRVPLPFHTGPGEDTAVSLALATEGFKIMYCAGASAVELIGPERMTVAWVVDRSRASGAVWRRLALAGSVPRWRVNGYAIKAILQGAYMAILSFVRIGERGLYLVQARRRFAFAKGALKSRA